VAIWRALLIVYREIDVRLPRRGWVKRQYRHQATQQEIDDASESFHAFPKLVANLTSGSATVEEKLVIIDSPLRSLSRELDCYFWPSPNDTREALDALSPPGSFESVFIFWPQNDSQRRTAIPCRGWGLGMAASDWSNRATYAVVANAPSWAWHREAPGEVWLHEWLHGVCHHFAERGHAMPTPDADGAEVHGYKRSPIVGWTDYYRDLLTGNVMENGKLVGIPRNAWPETNDRAV
jgi:hypothetical protein